MEIKEINIHAYLISGLLSWRREFSGSRRGPWMISRGEA
jgi:hypothetical protein